MGVLQSAVEQSLQSRVGCRIPQNLRYCWPSAGSDRGWNFHSSSPLRIFLKMGYRVVQEKRNEIGLYIVKNTANPFRMKVGFVTRDIPVGNALLSDMRSQETALKMSVT